MARRDIVLRRASMTGAARATSACSAGGASTAGWCRARRRAVRRASYCACQSRSFFWLVAACCRAVSACCSAASGWASGATSVAGLKPPAPPGEPSGAAPALGLLAAEVASRKADPRQEERLGEMLPLAALGLSGQCPLHPEPLLVSCRGKRRG